jgi:hypothetical protein
MPFKPKTVPQIRLDFWADVAMDLGGPASEGSLLRKEATGVRKTSRSLT